MQPDSSLLDKILLTVEASKLLLRLVESYLGIGFYTAVSVLNKSADLSW